METNGVRCTEVEGVGNTKTRGGRGINRQKPNIERAGSILAGVSKLLVERVRGTHSMRWVWSLRGCVVGILRTSGAGG